MKSFDIIIVGGGVVGGGLALALSKQGWRIALIDARKPEASDPRLFALNASSCQFLKNLALWPVLSSNAASIQMVHVSYQGYFGALRLTPEEIGLPSLGYVIPAKCIEAALHEHLQQEKNITLYQPAQLKKLVQVDGIAQLTVRQEDKEILLSAPLVIGADGTESTVREQAGIKTKRFDYAQSALVTRTQLKRPHAHIAYERFTDQGTIAMLPLADKDGDECATIWTGAHDEIERLYECSNADFLSALQTQFGYRLGRLTSISERHLFPLKQVAAEKNREGCVMLLGNAAHTMSPIAAQGFNLAIYEVAVLVECLLDKIDLEQVSILTQQQENISMGISHRLSQLNSVPASLLSAALPLGMIGLDIVAPLKKQLIKRLIGRAGRVPRLLLSGSEV